MLERPEPKRKTQRNFIRITFIITVLAWLSFLTLAVNALDHTFKKRLLDLENQVKELKAANSAMQNEKK